MNRAWLHAFSTVHQAAATIRALELLPLKHLHAVFFCTRTIPAWRLYTRVWDATSNELIHIARILDANGHQLHLRADELRRDSMQLMLAGTPAQIGEGLRILAANSLTQVQPSENSGML